jgi:hypothetical protein
MKKYIIILLLVTSSLWAEQNFKKAIGYSAGVMSGVGMTYRQVNENIGFQVCSGFSFYEDDIILFSGINIIKPIHSVWKTRLNIIGVIGNIQFWEDKEIDTNTFYTGIGPEVEITFSENIRFIISSPLTVYTPTDYDSMLIAFMPNISLMYYFR